MGDVERSLSIGNLPSRGSEPATRFCRPAGILMIQPNQNRREHVEEKNDDAIGITLLIRPILLKHLENAINRQHSNQ